ncbi:D-2-hydroxyglutarate dehydrogenase, mitochondrial-like isoform X2 [Adelges cooleyi]|uniref:D-2-hydroxyglutarate dehydrogenase, mitochondrial-like isoform X2 n=1 Tax=Adelges cooleyi TaxID=133065 RepID=UPI00217FFBCD|nr:D-2-hydroxyglutarate dehydrogenase, mitochondrial-like isoform X2 [Adelges cooleyi]
MQTAFRSFNLVRNLSTKPSLFNSTQLTKDKYPYLRRGPYAKIETTDIHFFQNILGVNYVITDQTELVPYNVDWLKSVSGYSKCVLKPKTTEQVSQILSYCHKRDIAICIQGGNTGLVGGSVPVFDEIILSTSAMNDIISFDKLSGILVCQAGCVLENLMNYVQNEGFIMPFDLGAKGSCQIGGNVATNAGGLRLIKYGSLQGSVSGLQVVLADGQILDSLSTLKKDNTGYHLKHIFIGSEGTLGVITKVAIQCPNAPKYVNVAFIGLSSFHKVLHLFENIRSKFSNSLSSFELMDSVAIKCVCENIGLKCPIDDGLEFYVLLELSTDHSFMTKSLQDFLEESFMQKIIEDATSADQPSQIESLWKIRESIPESLLRFGYVYKYDITLPHKYFYQILPDIKERLNNKFNVKAISGDGNLHLNVATTAHNEDVVSELEPYVYEWTSQYKGSISAEHGIGFLKRKYLKYSKSQLEIDIMKKLKNTFDNRQILNPYKIFP